MIKVSGNSYVIMVVLLSLMIVFQVFDIVGKYKTNQEMKSLKAELEQEKAKVDCINVLPVNEDKEIKNISVKAEFGEASWYDYDYPKGSGNWVTKAKYVAASRDYPRGTKLRVCSDQCVDITVTDYGPELSTGRIIDMGSLAFSKICSLRRGTCDVSVTRIQ